MAALQDDVRGLHILPDVLTAEEEGVILKFIGEQKWAPLTIKVDTGRLVQQYGFRFDYHSYGVVKDVPEIPDQLSTLIKKLISQCEALKIPVVSEFNQIIVNRYLPGEGISPHVDWKGFGPIVASFTLGSAAVVEFKKNGVLVETYPPGRSLYIMSGDARTAWTHSMPAREEDTVDGKVVLRDVRISITIRQVPDKS